MEKETSIEDILFSEVKYFNKHYSEIEDKIKVKNIFFAELKYFSNEHQGVEVMDPLSCVMVAKVGEDYVNLLKMEERYPTFDRIPYSNDYQFEDFGTKLRLLTETVETGPCWVLCEKPDDFSFDEQENVSLSELEDYVLKTPTFFKERMAIAAERMNRYIHPFFMYRVMKKDIKKHQEMQKFFDSRMKQSKKIK